MLNLPLTLLRLSLLLSLCSTNGELPRRTKFKAAVYEHDVLLPADPKLVVSRQEALVVMRSNLAAYEVQAAEANRQGADILVFPEDGLYGFSFTWDSITPYMEFIPNPAIEQWTPCNHPDRYPNTEVQQALSCMAKRNNLFIVANMGDRQPCHIRDSARCKIDIHTGLGHFQYNTDVAFDPQGKLVAKYHKKNLFFEYQYDTPTQETITWFNTPFGRWTMFTCFDILFEDPAVLAVQREGIANVAFPTAWMDALPLLSSIQFHSAFARGLGVNFLAANIHRPQWRFQGSGVYGPHGMLTFVHNATVGSPPRLLVTEMDVLERPVPPSQHTHPSPGAGTLGSTPSGSSQPSDGPSVVVSKRSADARDIAGDVSGEEDVTGIAGGITSVEVSKRSAVGDIYIDVADDFMNADDVIGEDDVMTGDVTGVETAFVAELFHDLFNFVQLERPQSTLSVCSLNICCYLNYTIQPSATAAAAGHGSESSSSSSSSSSSGTAPQLELFAFGAFDGLHTYEGQYYLQICALVRCANQSRSSCGQPTNQSHTSFQRLSVFGTGFESPDHVYPEVLLTSETSQLRLANAEEWSFGGMEIRSDDGLSSPLVSAALFGRVYQWDGEPGEGPVNGAPPAVVSPNTAACIAGKSSWWVLTGVLLVRAMGK